MSTNDVPIKPDLIAIFLRIAFFSIIWLVLVEGRLDSLWVGSVAIMASTYLSLRLLPVFSINILALPPFLIFFLWRSLIGGIDVAKRVIGTRLNIAPDLIVYPCQFSNELAQTFFINTVNLLPGTLVISCEEGNLIIHVLDKNSNNEFELREIEKKIAKILKTNTANTGK